MLSIPQLLFLIKVDIVIPNSSSLKGQSSSSIPMSKLFSGKSSCDTQLRSVPLDRPSTHVELRYIKIAILYQLLRNLDI